MAGDNAGQQLQMDDIDDVDDEEGDGKEEDVGEGGDQQVFIILNYIFLYLYGLIILGFKYEILFSTLRKLKSTT
jgi:hypothetical protein